MKKKINLLFLINDKFINNFETIYNKVKNSEKFTITVVACESKGTDYKEYISSDEIHDFLIKNNIKSINGFVKENNEYIDLRMYNPDYIFVSTPYDIYRPNCYNSSKLSNIAKVCDIEYGAILINDDKNTILDNPYYKNCYFHFVCSDKQKNSFINNNNHNILKKFVTIGCIKIDKYFSKTHKFSNWEKIFKNNSNKLRIVWKPRWTLENEKFFFEILNRLKDYLLHNKIEFILLEHPLLRSNLKSKNLINEYLNIINELNALNNFKIYNKFDFLDIVIESDILIGEYTSLMAEYSITNNTILYINSNDKLNKLGETIIKKGNIIYNVDDLFNKLNKIKHHKVKLNKNTGLFFPKNKSITDYLLEIIEEDYNNNNNYYKDKLNEYEQLICSIKKILIQGYLDKDILESESSEAIEIYNGLKIWNDTITKLTTKINDYNSDKKE